MKYSGQRLNYENANLSVERLAFEIIENGLTVRQLSKKYSIPRTTIQDRLKRELGGKLADQVQSIFDERARNSILQAGCSSTAKRQLKTQSWLLDFLDKYVINHDSICYQDLSKLASDETVFRDPRTMWQIFHDTLPVLDMDRYLAVRDIKGFYWISNGDILNTEKETELCAYATRCIDDSSKLDELLLEDKKEFRDYLLVVLETIKYPYLRVLKSEFKD